MSKKIIPQVEKSNIVYRGFFDMRVDHLRLPHGPGLDYTFLMTKTEAAAVLAETQDGKFVIIKEYRHPTKQWLLGCPGGRLDKGEDPLMGAHRELLEETGYHSDDLISLGDVFPFPAVCDQKIHFVYAKNAKLVQPTKHETFELIETTLMTKEELKEEIKKGTIVDGVLCTALLLQSFYS